MWAGVPLRILDDEYRVSDIDKQDASVENDSLLGGTHHKTL